METYFRWPPDCLLMKFAHACLLYGMCRAGIVCKPIWVAMLLSLVEHRTKYCKNVLCGGGET